MRLVSLRLPHGGTSPGAILGSSVINFSQCGNLLPELTSMPTSLRGILAQGRPVLDKIRGSIELASKETLASSLRQRGALTALENTQLAAPIPDPVLILSCGLNYHEHLREMNTPAPRTPSAFTKNAASVIGSEEKIVLPKSAPGMVDWEGEFTVVIGQPCFQVSASKALDYVAGYTIVNDVSARDWVAGVFSAVGTMPSILAWEHNILGKQFPTFCPMGPALVTADEVGDISDLKLQTRLNGSVMQSSSTSDLVFDVPAVIEYFSKFYHLKPGDLITTGSPPGVGYGRNPKVFMKPGDVVEVEVERIGILRNHVAAA